MAARSVSPTIVSAREGVDTAAYYLRRAKEKVQFVKACTPEIRSFERIVEAAIKRYAKATGTDLPNMTGAVEETYGQERDDDPRYKACLYVTIKTDNLREGAFPEVLSDLLDAGFVARSTTDFAAESYASRSFDLTLRLGRIRCDLRVDAQIPTDGEACRRVAVGTEVREVVKYAIVCDE